MRASTTLLLSTFALLQTALAIPPACLLGALNNDQQNLADISAICSKSAADVQGNISNLCGAMTNEALSYFADTCKQVANVSVASATKTSGSGAGASATGTHSSTDVLNNPTPTGSNGGSGGASTTASGSASSTGAAAPTHAAGSFAAVALAAAGLIVAV